MGYVFLNPDSGLPLTAGTLSYWMCNAIRFLVPCTKARAHDIRIFSFSLDWTRGLPLDAIVKNAFWSSSKVFTRKYLEVPNLPPCVAGRSAKWILCPIFTIINAISLIIFKQTLTENLPLSLLPHRDTFILPRNYVLCVLRNRNLRLRINTLFDEGKRFYLSLVDVDKEYAHLFCRQFCTTDCNGMYRDCIAPAILWLMGHNGHRFRARGWMNLFQGNTTIY